MSDYAPLDHEVRNRAIIGAREIGVGEAEAERQYDRWLAAHDWAIVAKAHRAGFMESIKILQEAGLRFEVADRIEADDE